MNYDEEIKILDHLQKGRTSGVTFRHYQRSLISDKYHHFREASAKAGIPSRKIKDMLLTASQKTQAIFKISSFGKGENRVAAHLQYITRCGKLELEDQDGNKHKTAKERRELVRGWSVDFGTNTRSRDTLHLVLSAPPGSNREKMREAAKEFLEAEFKSAGHEYVFVAHNDTEHPHVHTAIKMVSSYGKKLNPRKAYLRQVREKFAEICRSHDIEVEASSRAERGLPGASKGSEFVQMKKAKRRPNADISLINMVIKERQQSESLQHPSTEKMLKRNQIIRKRYAERAKQVAEKAMSLSDALERDKYLKAAKTLDDYAKTLPLEKTRGEKLHQQLDAKESSIGNLRYLDQKEQAVDQYEAVTLGVMNEKGIYISPKRHLNQKIRQLIAEQSTQLKGQAAKKELEIDYDD